MTAISELENQISVGQRPVEQRSALPKTLAEFLEWEPEDGFKYEWNDGEIIQFNGMDKKEMYMFDLLLDLLIEKGLKKNGTLIAEQNVMLTGIQMRRPDIAYFSKIQMQNGRNGIDEIPEFVIEVISSNDNLNKVEEKLTEYFKAGVKVVWKILPEHKIVYVYTSRKTVQICMDNDICSANPVLPEFEIRVGEIFG
ncbi:Uma2 family endonuclease [Emticicia sp.]|uniref:Uma2 family endonuclease n=1 Tax=Emticicia sp. TaxID=1930953 RepID=UPI0037512CC5